MMTLHRLVFGALAFAGTALATLPAAAAGITGEGQLQILGQCLDANNWNATPGSHPDVWGCTNSANQEWVVGADGTIRPVFDTSKCLDLPAFETTDGTPIQLWTCNGGANQQWDLSADGTIKGYGGKCIDNPDWDTKSGTTFDYWDCNGGTNQKFALTQNDSSPPIVFSWPNVSFPTPGVTVAGNVALTLYQDGSYDFSGAFNDSGALDYNLQVVCIAKDSNATGYSFTATGFMHGWTSSWLGGSNNTSFSQSASNNALKSDWWLLQTQQDIHGGAIQCTASVNSDLNSLLGQFSAVVGVAGTVIGIAAL
jgi:hypothetical protein